MATNIPDAPGGFVLETDNDYIIKSGDQFYCPEEERFYPYSDSVGYNLGWLKGRVWNYITFKKIKTKIIPPKIFQTEKEYPYGF